MSLKNIIVDSNKTLAVLNLHAFILTVSFVINHAPLGEILLIDSHFPHLPSRSTGKFIFNAVELI